MKLELDLKFLFCLLLGTMNETQCIQCDHIFWIFRIKNTRKNIDDGGSGKFPKYSMQIKYRSI